MSIEQVHADDISTNGQEDIRTDYEERNDDELEGDLREDELSLEEVVKI